MSRDEILVNLWRRILRSDDYRSLTDAHITLDLTVSLSPEESGALSELFDEKKTARVEGDT